MNWRDEIEKAFNCGCPGKKRTDEEVERELERIEEERKGIPVVIPVTPKRIPVENWPVREPVRVPVKR